MGTNMEKWRDQVTEHVNRLELEVERLKAREQSDRETIERIGSSLDYVVDVVTEIQRKLRDR